MTTATPTKYMQQVFDITEYPIGSAFIDSEGDIAQIVGDNLIVWTTGDSADCAGVSRDLDAQTYEMHLLYVPGVPLIGTA